MHPKAALAADPVAESTLREPITVNLDQAKLVKLPERTATLVIGNPLIADAAGNMVLGHVRDFVTEHRRQL